MATSFKIEVFRTFIESKEKNKKGKPISFPVDIRKMYIEGDFITTKKYQATVVKRNGERYISVKQLMEAPKPKWPCPLIDKPKEPKWVKEGNYTIEKFTDWLRLRIGVNAPSIVSELLTAPPENLAA